MRVICCHSGDIHPLTAESLARYAPQAEFVETAGLYGYNDAIASRWDGSDDLVVIEQDKEITAEVLPSFAACAHRWCTYSLFIFPEPHQRETAISLGCVKFSAEAQRLVKPDEFLHRDFDWNPCPDCSGKGCWRYLDSRIAFALLGKSVTAHVHGRVKHHHDYPPDWALVRGLQ